MTDNIFLYFACLSAIGALFAYGKSFTPPPKSAAPALVQASLRLTAAFCLTSTLPWSLLWLSERYAWFAGRPGTDLLFTGVVVTLMISILWAFIRAIHPLAAELRRLKEEVAGGPPALPSRLKTAAFTGGVYAFGGLFLSLLSPYLSVHEPGTLAAHALLYPLVTFVVGFAGGWLLHRTTPSTTFSSRMWPWYLFGVVLGLARVRLDHWGLDLLATGVSCFIPALLFAWIFGLAVRRPAEPRTDDHQ